MMDRNDRARKNDQGDRREWLRHVQPIEVFALLCGFALMFSPFP